MGLIALSFVNSSLKAQQSTIRCGTDQILERDTVLQRRLMEFDRKFQRDKRARTGALDMTTVFTIPVVFHVYHLGEPVGTGSNVSLAAIQATLESLNAAFRATGKYAGKTPDVKIQFVMAARTPNCQGTEGVVRVDARSIAGYEANGVDANDNIKHDELRRLSNWLGGFYINIRIVNKITNAAGFAYFLDDVFIDSYYVKNGTADVVMTHEMGHSMNLYHTFQGDGNNMYCPENTDPETQGDLISDTDPHKQGDGCKYDAINPCTARPFGSVLKNFMSYSCSEQFTPKQIERMRYALMYYREGLINSLGKEPATATLLPKTACQVTAKSPNPFYGIGHFALADMTYHSSSVSLTTYVDLTCLMRTELRVGKTYGFSLASNFANFSYGNVYIDYNNDGDFEDENEAVFKSIVGNLPHNGAFVVPATAQLNTPLRLRVVVDISPNLSACLLPGAAYGSGMALDATVTILPNNCTQPARPIATSASRCGSGTVNLTASGCNGGTYHWYFANAGGTPLGEGATFTTPTFTTTTSFYVDCTVGDCVSPRTEAKGINTAPDGPYLQNITIGTGQSTTLLTPTCQNGTVKWYSAAGAFVGTGASFATPVLTSSVVYFATCTVNGCESERRTIAITVGTPSVTLGALSSTSYCSKNLISVPFTSSLPAGTVFTVTLRKGSYIVSSMSGMGSPINVPIPTGYGFSDKYTVQVTTDAGSFSPLSDYLSIGDITYATVVDTKGNSLLFNDVLCTGSSKVYRAKVDNSFDKEGLTYQWFKDGILVNQATSPELAVAQAGVYSFTVKQAGCSINSNSSTLKVGNTITVANFLYGDEIACVGTTKKIESYYYSTTATYQWQKDGVDISGATSRDYHTTQSGGYRVLVKDGSCTAMSALVQVRFMSSLNATIFAGNDTTLCGEQYKSLSGSQDIKMLEQYTYQWQKDGEDIAGANSYYYNAVQPGVYSLRYRQGSCTSTSKGITIIKSDKAQKPIIQAGEITNICSGSIVLNRTDNSSPGIWYKDGIALSNTSSFTYTTSVSGTYKMVVGEGTCVNESNAVTVSIGTNRLTPKIYIPTPLFMGKTSLCGTGDYLLLYFDNRNLAGGTYTYQWKKGGVAIEGGTSDYLFVSSPGDYSLVVTNGNCTATSNTVTITNTPALTLTASDNDLNCGNRVVKLEVMGGLLSMTAPIVWRKDNVVIPKETLPFLYANQKGVYTATLNQGGCVGTTAGVALNTGLGVNFTIQGPSSVQAGLTATLTTQNCKGTTRWYSQNGDLLANTGANSLTTSPLSSSTVFYATCTINDCESAQLIKTVSIVENPPCPPTITHSGSVTGNTYIARETIVSSAFVAPNTTYQAGQSIVLTPGFKTSTTGVFKAQIGGCN